MTRKLLSLATLTIAGYASVAVGQSFSDNFNSGTDAAWTHWGPPPATASWSFPTRSPGNLGYRLQASPGTASFATSARAGSHVTGWNSSDFVVSSDLVGWDPLDEMQMGVMARVQTPIGAGVFPGTYALVYINRFSVRGNGTDQLRILRLGPAEITFLNDGLGNQGQFGVVAGGSAAPLPGGSYRLEFNGSGNTFMGRIRDNATGLYMTFNDGNGNLTDFIHASDPNSTFSSGSAGVLTIQNTLTPGVDTTFDNFLVTVPEPSAAALGALGLAALWAARRKAQSR